MSTPKENPSSPTKMNATNLYVTTTEIILKSDPSDPSSWQDLYRLFPYLRNSLCCVVCSMLLVNPCTPTNSQCQHHLCQNCKGKRKTIKPQCENCKDCKDYSDNKCLKILMQMYKKMCINLINSQIFHCIQQQASQPGTGFERGAFNLIHLIKEGASFEDYYESRGGLAKSTYSILPCIYINSNSIRNSPMPRQSSTDLPRTVIDNQNKNLYSVVYPGNGNKITLKRKLKDTKQLTSTSAATITVVPLNKLQDEQERPVFKKPLIKPKKGCRCGNATATPGKLTCCGQRCLCYVESKACIDCKCRGCRNPHTPDGNKIMPYIPRLGTATFVKPPVVDGRVDPGRIVVPTASSTQQSCHLLKDDPILTNVKLDSIQLDTFDTTSNSHFKIDKYLTSGFDQFTSLISTDFLPCEMEEDM